MCSSTCRRRSSVELRGNARERARRSASGQRADSGQSGRYANSGTELAEASGRALYAGASPGSDGIRRVLRRVGSLSDEARAEAQSFASSGPAIFLAIGENPPAALLATSKDSGLHAGDLLKSALAEAGGRGGGNAALAQGSVPSKDALDALSAKLASQLKLPS